MSSNCNPYAPPRSEVAVATKELGHGWRIENHRLLVNDGAVLPAICILGGDPDHPVERMQLHLRVSSGLQLRHSIWIEAFESRREHMKRSIGSIGSLVLGFAGGVISSVLMVGDGSATPASVSVSFSLIALGIVGASWQGRHLPRVTLGHEGWYQIGGISPKVLACLKQIQNDSGESAS